MTAAVIAMAVSVQRYPFLRSGTGPHVSSVFPWEAVGEGESTSLIRILLLSVFVTVDFVFDLLESRFFALKRRTTVREQ